MLGCAIHHHYNYATPDAVASKTSSPRCKTLHYGNLTSPLSPTQFSRLPTKASNGCTTIDHSDSSLDTVHHQLSPVRIAYTDDAMLTNSRTNMLRLLHAAQQPTSTTDNSVLMAKKALRYRHLLAQAQAADMDDPAFEINDFLRVSARKQSLSRTCNL